MPRHLFIGAGGAALPLLQLTGIPEAKQYGGFPVGGEFLVTDNPAITARHLAKVYGLADTGSPPMSVPHLDTRVLDGKTVLLFGPFATWSTKFLKNGSYFDIAKATTPSNVIPQLQVGAHEFALVKYLAQQLELSMADKMAALRHYMPDAKDGDWRLWQAGQRVQIIKKIPGQGGVLKLGTEVVVSADRSVSALLGASPGGSTSPAIMLSLLEKVFPEQIRTGAWLDKIRTIVPSYGKKLNENPALLATTWATTADTLKLTVASPSPGGIRRRRGHGRAAGTGQEGVGYRAVVRSACRRVSVDQQALQKRLQTACIVFRKPAQEPCVDARQGRHDLRRERMPLLRQFHLHLAPVGVAPDAAHDALRFEPVEQARHGARIDAGKRTEFIDSAGPAPHGPDHHDELRGTSAPAAPVPLRVGQRLHCAWR